MASASFLFVLAQEPGDEFYFREDTRKLYYCYENLPINIKKNYRERPQNRIHIICSENALSNYFSFYEKVLDN